MKDKPELALCPGLQVPGGGREIRETLPVQVQMKETNDSTEDQDEALKNLFTLAKIFDFHQK